MAVLAGAIRREREAAQLSLSELARRSGLAKSTLSQLEAGLGNPGLETLWALANALAIPVSRLMTAPRRPVRVMRLDDGAPTRSAEADYGVVLLADQTPGSRRDLYRVTAQPGSVRRSSAHAAGTVEHVVICRGQASVGPESAPVTLSCGDYITYAADVPHVFEALEPDTVAVMLIDEA
jgi:transcriptional regulator with XRE-family HTH domain